MACLCKEGKGRCGIAEEERLIAVRKAAAAQRKIDAKNRRERAARESAEAEEEERVAGVKKAEAEKEEAKTKADVARLEMQVELQAERARAMREALES